MHHIVRLHNGCTVVCWCPETLWSDVLRHIRLCVPLARYGPLLHTHQRDCSRVRVLAGVISQAQRAALLGRHAHAVAANRLGLASNVHRSTLSSARAAMSSAVNTAPTGCRNLHMYSL